MRKLNELSSYIETMGGMNLLSENVLCEDFYSRLLNLLYNWDLKNMNEVRHNMPAIDLVDARNSIVAQVSATATKTRVESALSKDLSKYKGYTFKFVSISKDANNLRGQTFINPHQLVFSPAQDILDVPFLLGHIKHMDIDRLKEVYELVKKELKSEPVPEKIESNLAAIINILSKENWNTGTQSFERLPFDIETKISFNDLNDIRSIIDEYKVHHHRIAKIYSEFDLQGANKSLSILNGIRREYLSLNHTPKESFLKILNIVIDKIRTSANYSPIQDEELSICVDILVVDAFIRCKIFKNPSGDNNASP